jgi:hypothetical protein
VIPSRAPWKVKAMKAKVPRGPHLLCFRCDSLDVKWSRCQHCGHMDMVARCHKDICGACSEAKERRAARRRRRVA